MNELAIIADDLTGASDSGVQLARQGLKTFVFFEIDQTREDIKAADVIVVDTDSRAIPSDEAYQRVASAAKKLKEIGTRHFLKKVDSTLRGNIGAEIDGVLDVISCDFAIIAPAFPRIGRTTVNGRHYLHGTPVDQTEIAKDPKCPVKESDIVTLLSSQSKRRVGLVKRSVLQEGEQAVLDSLHHFKQEGIQLIVFDAEADEDLQRIVGMVSGSSYDILWVGSAGLADYMNHLFKKPVHPNHPLLIEPIQPNVMLVAGSLSQVTRKQVEYFSSYRNVASIEIDPLRIIVDGHAWAEEIHRCRSGILDALSKGRDIAFFVSLAPELSKWAAAQNIHTADVANRIADALGVVASEVLSEWDLQGVILTGGDTARSVCKHLGVSGIQPLDEVEAGIPLSRMIGYKGLLTVTKAGAFGKEDSLVHALQVLKGAN